MEPYGPAAVETLECFLSAASKVTLERGAQQTVELKLSDPAR